MKCLVTGGFGFIGTNLVVELLDRGHEVIVIDDCSSDSVSSPQWSDKCGFIQCDIAKPDFYERHLDGVDVCFHLAAKARVQPSIENPALFDFTNVHGTVCLLKACVDSGIKKVVFSSSSSVYGDAELPTSETHPLSPKSPYGLQKKIGEDYLKLFSEIYDIKTVALRYFNVYGEGMPLGGAYATAIGIFLNQAINGQKVTIFGDGEQTRDFTYVKDIVEANILSATTDDLDDFEIFNVGNSDNCSVNHVADLIGGDREYLDAKLEPRATLADNSKIKEKLGWAPTGDLDSWVKEYKKTINLIN
jgi:UDP-glucose 4-epimerase